MLSVTLDLVTTKDLTFTLFGIFHLSGVSLKLESLEKAEINIAWRSEVYSEDEGEWQDIGSFRSKCVN